MAKTKAITAESFEQSLITNFSFTPTKGQERLFYAFTRMMFSDKPRVALIIKGYAGTGKTTTVSAMVKTLLESGKKVVLLAPTGRAAKVLSNYSGTVASTIHKQIYYRKADRSGNTWFELKENEMENTVFFVDEASMIGTERFSLVQGDVGSGDLLEDLISHIYSGVGCRMVLIGDGAQLPPVGSAQSPALRLDFLRDEYSMNIAEIELNEVIRQKEGSGILENATRLRDLINAQSGQYPEIVINGFKDIAHVTSDLQPILEEGIRNYGLDGSIIITRSNKRANLYNQQIRVRILGNEDEINSGDRMMVLKNNYFWLDEQANTQAGFIANGDVIIIERVRKFEERGDFRFCRAVVRLADYPDLPEMEVLLLVNTIWEESSGISYEKMKELWNIIAKDYEHLESVPKIRKAIQEDPYYNALHVKFAYAITCHKSQGGQWPFVVVDQGYITEEMHTVELNRWFYTAFTRAQKELFLIGFSS
ncbi:MAG: ATP-dependent DNA helicase [Flavobacteriales bacterium]